MRQNVTLRLFARCILALALTDFANYALAKSPVTDCLGDIRQSLNNGDFTGPTDCDFAEINLHQIGTIQTRSTVYAIYDFRYRTRPERGMVAHGGQKVLVLEGDSKYLGQYPLSPPPFRKIKVKKNIVEIDIPAEHGNQIEIGVEGPPAHVRLDEEIVHLTK